MYLTAAMRELMLEPLDAAVEGSLHTAYSTSGGNEVTGGSPAYARQALTWAAAASDSKSLTSPMPSWDVPASTTFAWWGGWDIVGNFLFMMPITESFPRNMSADADDVTNNTIQCEDHGLVADDRVVFWPGSGSGLPGGLSVGTIYFVIATGLTSDVFSVSTSSGGSAVNITDEGAGFAQMILPQAYASQGTYGIASATIDLAALVFA